MARKRGPITNASGATPNVPTPWQNNIRALAVLRKTGERYVAESFPTPELEGKKTFTSRVIDQRAEAYINQANNHLQTERKILEGFLPPGRAVMMFMMMKPLMQQQV